MEIILRNSFYLRFLLFIPFLILMHYVALSYFKKKAIRFANFVAIARVSQKVGISSNNFVLFLRILVLVAVVFSIAGTTVLYEGTEIDADYVIVIDSSASMLANDLLPNRFESAKSGAEDFVGSVPLYTSVGIVGFSGISYVERPLTNDKQLLHDSIQNLGILNSGGTDIGGAIVTGTNLLLNSVKPRVLILLTDGRSNVGFDVSQAIDYANQNRIIINTIGVGTEEGFFVDVNETLGPLGVNYDELESIASLTGGEFFNVNSSEELVDVYNYIAKVKKTKVSLDLTFFLLVFILIILFIEWILVNTRFRIIP